MGHTKKNQRGGVRKRARAEAAAAAAAGEVPDDAGFERGSYAALLGELANTPAVGVKKAATAAKGASAGEAAEAPAPVAEESGEEDGEELSDGADGADGAGDDDDGGGGGGGSGDDDDDEAQWSSAAYNAHFDVEWTPEELETKRAALQTALWTMPGLGPARATVGAGATQPAPPKAAEACLKRCGVIPALRARWVAAHGPGELSGAQRSLLALLAGYKDVLGAGTPLGAYEELMPVLALHASQHMVLTRRLLQRHQKKGLTPQDQGFTRPTVLVVLPFRAHALAFVHAFLRLLPAGIDQVENKARFVKEFSEEEGAPPMPASKPEDYRALFDGNNDDCFRCAVRLTRKSAKLYASFYSADLVVASPLGLRVAIGAEGDKGARDVDWLSSIEVCLCPYADVMLMQNWAHVEDLFAALNQLPTSSRDTDFSRVRSYYLEGQGRLVRQTALLAAHPAPELSALIGRTCANAVGGRVVTAPHYDGCLGRAPHGVRQLFVRFDAEEPIAEADARLRAFKTRLLPSLLSAMSAGVGVAQTLLFVPRYFDFVRVKALLVAEDVPFVSVSEYATASQVSRARSSLQKREVPLLVYTERAHFFRRHKLRGARHLAVYSPPSYADFYVELLQMLDHSGAAGAPAGGGAGGDSTCAMLFCRLDLPPLQRLVGSERAARMLTGDEASFLFTA